MKIQTRTHFASMYVVGSHAAPPWRLSKSNTSRQLFIFNLLWSLGNPGNTYSSHYSSRFQWDLHSRVKISTTGEFLFLFARSTSSSDLISGDQDLIVDSDDHQVRARRKRSGYDKNHSCQFAGTLWSFDRFSVSTDARIAPRLNSPQ